ncbi:uncharacterized protein LOC119723487 isoform X2 [Patiria miniata]|nr:uncharacterized protein LOC119723487 isoform X2 [Patiria miniata]
MLHYVGRPMGEEMEYVVGTNGELTRERLRQLASTRLAEQGRIGMQEANLMYHREAAAMQHKFNAAVAAKPLYSIGDPQRIRMPRPPPRFAEQLPRHPLYDGPLNLVNRHTVPGHLYAGVTHPSLDGHIDLSKPLDLSMKSQRLSVSRPPKTMVDPRLISMANAEMLAKQSHSVRSNGHDVTSKVTSAPTMYRPPPMMSYSKPGRHGNGINPSQLMHGQHSVLSKEVTMTQGHLHPLSSSASVASHIRLGRTALKRPPPVLARSASDIPLKRAVLDKLSTERLKIAPSSNPPTSVGVKTYPDASSRAALLAYEPGRSHAVSMINQPESESQLRITDVRSIASRAGTSHPAPVPTSTPSRPRTNKADGAPVFHHIHHHHHHHHVPQPDEEVLRQGTNGAQVVHAHGAVPVHGGVLATGGAGPANGLPTHDIPSHRLAPRMVTGHEVPTMAAPNMASSRGDRLHGVLIKHTTTPVSTITSPHLRRAHYHTRRRSAKSISPPTLVSHAGLTPLRLDSTGVASTPIRAHQHARATSPLKLVASSIAAGAKMNELLKPLDGPEQPSASGHNVTNNNNNNKVVLPEKLARPLRVDIPDDSAFVSHLGDVYTGQSNPVPLVRQVSNAANITKCPTSEACSSPKKSNSSGNESPTMPVLTPQSVYSPCFATESATNLTHISSNVEPQPTSSPMFYSALTLPLYSRKQDTEAVQKLLRAKDESPPNLNETSPEQLVPDQRVPNTMDRFGTLIQQKIDIHVLEKAAAVDKSKREQKLQRERMQEERDVYHRYFQEFRRAPLDKPRKRRMHGHGLKASMDRLKAQQPKRVRERIQPTGNHDDRNIFAELMLQRHWYEGKMHSNQAKEAHRQLQHADVIDLTSPSSSPAPDAPGSSDNKTGGSGGIGREKPKTIDRNVNDFFSKRIISAYEEGRTVSMSDAIEAVLAAHMPIIPGDTPDMEQKHRDSSPKKLNPDTQQLRRVPQGLIDLKDQPPKLVRVQESPLVSSSVTAPVANACAVITSARSSTVPSPFSTTNDFIKSETASVISTNPLSSTKQTESFLTSSPFFTNYHLSTTVAETSQALQLGSAPATLSTTSSLASLPHHLRFSPTEKTFSHDPRKKLLAAMNVQTSAVPSSAAVSPASIAASLCSTVSPSSGRSTPSKGSSRKRSLEISRLENTSSYVAAIPKRRQSVDPSTDPALLDREERALQRAMKRFNEMEKREKGIPSDTQTDPLIDPLTNNKKHNRFMFSKHSPIFRKGRGRGRKFMGFQRKHHTHKDVFSSSLSSHKDRRTFSRGMRRLTNQGGRSSFQDFVPMVLEERTRHSLATRSSARERKVYHKNARYEMEIEKEERKYLERKRQKRSLSGSTSGEDEASSVKGKNVPGRRRKGTEDVTKKSNDDTLMTEKSMAPGGKPNASGEWNSSGEAPEKTDVSAESESVVKSPGMDAPLHVVLDPTNHTKMRFMTSSAYELHRKDSGKENKDIEAKPGGKRKFKAKHIGPATEDDVRHDDSVTVKTEVFENLPIASQPEPSPVKVVRPEPPAEMKRLMVNKKLGETILHRAARLAYDDVAIYCIDYDVVDINAKDNAGYTPLHECCVHGRLRVALYLLQHGADVNASASDGTRPIHDAVDNNWLALVRLLLTYGADPLISTYSGRTTIKLARTQAMKTFIIGYLSDINGDWDLDEGDPYQSNLDLRWHLTGTHSFDANGLPVSDIFQDVPEEKREQSKEEFLFEVSDTPHLTSYNFSLPNDRRPRNWLLLPDVTNQLNTTRADFLASNRSMRSATLTLTEFTAAISRSQLNCTPPEKSGMMLDETSGDHVVELLELTSELRKTLQIEEVYI